MMHLFKMPTLQQAVEKQLAEAQLEELRRAETALLADHQWKLSQARVTALQARLAALQPATEKP